MVQNSLNASRAITWQITIPEALFLEEIANAVYIHMILKHCECDISFQRGHL